MKPEYEVTLDDGRVVSLSADSEEEAQRWAERWASFNPPGDGEVGTYEVQLDNGDVYNVPAVNQEAATAYFDAWTPEIMAREDAQRRQEGAAGVGVDGNLKSYDGTMNAVNAASFGADKILTAGIDAAVTGVRNLTGNGPGYGMAEAFNASREAQNNAQRDYQDRNPGMSLLTGLAGGGAVPGIGAAGRFITRPGLFGQAGRGGVAALNSTIGQAARAAAVSAPAGAVAGALNADPGNELVSARNGAVTAGLFGGGIPVVARGATGLSRLTGLDALPAVINRSTGGRFNIGGTADDRAMGRLGETLRRDGMTPAQIQAVMTQRPGVNLLDAIGNNATRTRAVIQGSAMKPGPAMNAAGAYRDQVAGSLQNRAINRTYELTPGENRTAQQYRTQMDDLQSRLADGDYLGPYQTRVPVTPEIDRAIRDVPGQIGQARNASAFRFPERAQEMDGLMNPDQIVDDVSAATLDSIQRRLGRTGQTATQSVENPDNDFAADMFARRNAINDALDNVPELREARASFRGYQQAMDGTDLGQTGIMPATRPADYADELNRMQQISQDSSQIAGRSIPDARTGAGVGLRDSIVNRIGNAKEGQTGFLNTLSTAPNTRQVLESTYGGQAQGYQDDIGQMVEGLNNARFIDPSTGSPTASRLGAEDLVPPPAFTPVNAVMAIINKIRRGATLTDAEREAIVRLSTQPLQTVPQARSLRPTISGQAAPGLSVWGSEQQNRPQR